MCDVGRKFARKEGFLPIHELVVWLEESAHRNFYSTAAMQVGASVQTACPWFNLT